VKIWHSMNSGKSGRRSMRGNVSASSFARVDRLLREQAVAKQQLVNPPPDLAFRIMDSIHDLQRGEGRFIPPSAMTWRPFLGIAAAAAIAGVMTLGIYMVAPGATPGERMQPGPRMAEVPAAARDGGRDGVGRPLTLDPAPTVLPAGRMVISRVESPLLNEAELLRRDTQRATEIVLSHLPFGGGLR
jgi:hypothetical protein